MAGTVHEKALAAEWLAVILIEVGDSFNQAKTTTTTQSGSSRLKLPPPSRFMATMFVYLMLAAAALFGENPGKVAAGLGGLVALTLVLAPPHPKTKIGPGNQPPVVSFFQWIDKMLKDPPSVRGATGHLQTTTINKFAARPPGTRSNRVTIPGTTPPVKTAPGVTGGQLGGIR